MTKKKADTAEMTDEELAAQGRELGIAELRGRLGDEVTIYPLEGVWISGVPHEELTVDAERAFDLLGFFPPAFTTEKPPEPEAPVAEPPTESQPSGDAGATPQEA
jgi:hypothetical protein